MTHSDRAHFEGLADYNRWANAQIYADAASLGSAIHDDIGLYFCSVFATLAHVLRVDRTWLHLIGGGTLDTLALAPQPGAFAELVADRVAVDEAIINLVAKSDIAAPFAFTSRLGGFAGRSFRGTVADIFAHLFNHQTHHRGQAHAGLTMLGLKEPRPLDLLVSRFE